MKTTFMNVSRGVIGALAFSLGISSCQSSQSKMTFEQEADSLTVIHITNPTQYLLLPGQRRRLPKHRSALLRTRFRRHGRTPVKGESGLFCSLCFA